MKPKRECYATGCHQLIDFDETYCGNHKHLKRERDRRYDYNRNREDKQYRKIYKSRRWQELRKQVMLRDEFLCQECKRNDLTKTGDVVDHIIELKDDLSKAFDMANLEVLCHACHNAKTIREKQKREHKSPFLK